MPRRGLIVSCIALLLLSLSVAGSPNIHSGSASAAPDSEDVPASQVDEETGPVFHGPCPRQYAVIPPYSFGSPDRAVSWYDYPALAAEPGEDFLWKARYEVYQQLITTWSGTSVHEDGVEAPPAEGNPVALLHGRSDVLDNATLILDIAPSYPQIPAILVAASIAQQASDIERAFGVDILEQIVLNVPGFDNMSIGIAQLRPTETESLGLGYVDLFEPEDAIRGMFTKIAASGDRIDALQSRVSAVPATDRAMLMSLAQNNPRAVDTFFAAGGDWDVVRAQDNNQRVMRYFLVHLDWLLESGWELPGDVDLERWRVIVFSTPVKAREAGVKEGD